MWRSYLGPGCRVYGVDIQDCRAFESEGVRIFISDQADPDFWRRFREDVRVLDVVIDDGGHMYEQQTVTLEQLLPHLQEMVGRDGIEPPTPGFSGPEIAGLSATTGRHREGFQAPANSHYGTSPDYARWWPLVLTQL
jgi:hypothetical protein